MEEAVPELTIREFLQILRESWVFVLASALLCTVIAAVIAFIITPTYRVDALLSPVVASGGGGSSLAAIASRLGPAAGLLGSLDSGGGVETKEVYIATLRSRRLTEEFIRMHDLLPVFFPEQWNDAEGRWKIRDGKPWIPVMDTAVRLFDEEIRSISEDRRTGLVTLGIEWSDPNTAATWASSLVAHANELLQKRYIAEARRSMAFLEEELEKTDVVERRQIIYGHMESKVREIMMAKAREEYAFFVIDPAVAPDESNFERPKRAVLVLIGLMLGLLFGVAYAWIRSARIIDDNFAMRIENKPMPDKSGLLR